MARSNHIDQNLAQAVGTPCRASSCLEITAGRKPYCSSHVRHMTYAVHLEAELERRDAEAARVEAVGAGAVDPRGSRAREILDLLEDGPQNLATFVRQLDVSREVFERYVEALERAGLVRVEHDRYARRIVCAA